ncbi:MAG TPA: PVC-type heme-binding CxxCH protein, partial [Cytophagaceae bacterium]
MSFNLKYLIIFLSLLMPFSCKRAVKNSTSSKNLEETAFSGDLFEVHVRTTEPLLPEEQKKSFQLPPGFEIELFASEPQIGKPINLAFDSRGRLWVTQSFEYPFAAKNKGRDKITILEDKNGDGRADSFTNFDDTLNIPIGIFPTQDGAIGFSIPHIYKFKDLDNNGKADETQVLYGKFGHKDTHGMVNNLVRGYDGWIHSCHGYTNTSTIVGKDGDTVTLVSGNTFRFKEDGSRIEHTTYGRVNPFGMAFDEWGYLYSADCHSSPIYQMIMGGDYPTFGKKEEAIGFAPAIKPHGSESTALSGLAYYDDNKFPQEYQKNFYLGDVVKSRVYMYSFEKKGSTSILTKETDFLLSTDPWFRPVDVKLGPDGAIYVADFYNRIIDHYEVPLDHPGRDRIRGRIWKITYNPKKVQQANKMPDWSAKNASELIDGLTSPNITERMLITDQLVDRVGKGAIAPLKETLNKKGSPLKVIHSLWSLYRLGALENNLLQQYFKSPDPKIRTHVLRIIREAAEDSVFEPLITKALKDKDANVQRAAVEALGKYPSLRNLSLLLELKKAIPAYDNHLLYTTNLTLRNLLRNENLMKQVLTKIWSDKEKNLLAEVATGVNSSSSAKFLFNLLKAGGTGANLEIPIVRHIAHYLPDQELDDFIAYVQTRFSDNIKAQFQIADNCLRGQRGKLSNGLLQWGISLSKNFLNTPSHWRYQPLNGGMGTTTPITVFTSEQDDTLIGLVGIVGQAVGWLAGIMMSPEFEAPDSLTFTVALSGEIPLKKEKGIYDFVRLKAVNDRDKILVEQQFVRDKMKEEVKIKWNLSAFKGQKVYLEVVKNSYRTGFIGIGNLK